MANVYVNTLGVPRKARNKRIYAGNSFAVTNQSQQSSSGQRHFETGKLSAEILDNHVICYFTTAFTNKPVCVNLKVYRMVEDIPSAGKWIMQDVLHYFDDDVDWVVTTGFSFYIDASEPLDGVILEYCFTE